jgi:CxxC motif-containing protein (DUF1111 family)
MKLLKLGSVLFLSILCCVTFANETSLVQAEVQATEAPAGFDNLTNGMVDQTAFDEVKEIFEDTEAISDGIGPVYNALSCTECHQNPVTGGNSQIVEVRAGHWNGQVFTDHPGGSLIHSRAIDASVQERIMDGNEVRAFRAATSVLGLGFVEAIRDETLISIANAQPFQSGGLIRGQIVRVDVIEAPGVTRVGRFGWKNQQASLLSFSADAYINEMGITTPMAPIENDSNGSSIELFDHVPLDDPTAPDDEGIDDLEAFAAFMRASKAPPRDATLAATVAARAGATLFNQIGCAVCHVTTITTAPTGTSLNGGTFVVPEALGNKTIHPYSDFLLHDVGTGDGIVQGLALTRNRMRTPPLWGLRTKNRLMHDGLSMTFNEAILRHGGEAGFVVLNYRFLSNSQRDNLLTFLRSL